MEAINKNVNAHSDGSSGLLYLAKEFEATFLVPDFDDNFSCSNKRHYDSKLSLK
jgi:hypothetical protein